MRKLSPDIFKYQCISILRIIFRLFERSNKIVSRFAQKALLDIIKSNASWCIFIIELTVEFGFKNPNRNARQLYIDILRESIERIADPKIMKYSLAKCYVYINSSVSDSCDIVRATAKKIHIFLERYHTNLHISTKTFVSANNDVNVNSPARKNTETFSWKSSQD